MRTFTRYAHTPGDVTCLSSPYLLICLSSLILPLQVSCYDQDVVTEMEAEPKELGAEHHATQTLTFTDSMGEVKDEQPPGWSTATTDMKFEYLLYGHRDQLACQVCGKTFLDESRLRYVLNITTD